MTDWYPQIAGRSGPRYRAIVAALADGIGRGRLKPGDRLPTQRELARRLGVTLGTVTRAYSHAEAEGLIEGQVGRGTFVSGKGSTAKRASRGGSEPEILDFSRDAALAGPFVDVLERTFLNVSSRDGRLSSGQAFDREAAARFLRTYAGIKTPASRLFPLSSPGAAFGAILLTCTETGAPVMTAESSDPVFLRLLRTLRHPPQPVVADAGGLRPESLELACWASGAKTVHVAPDGQLPTGAVMPEERRRELVRVARRYDLWIIEDRSAAVFGKDLITPVAALAPERTVAVWHAPRTLYPDLPISIVVPPADLAPAMGRTAAGLGADAAELPASIFSHWLHDGSADEIVGWQRDQAAKRRILAEKHLSGTPTGDFGGTGYMLWVRLRLDHAVDEAARHLAVRKAGKLAVLPSSTFWAGEGSAPQRLGIGLGGIEGLTAFQRALPVLADGLGSLATDSQE